MARAGPNAGHRLLAELERHSDFWLVTQNVDGLHVRAGSSRVLELHGSLWRLRCTVCAGEVDDERVPLPVPPQCPACGGLQRPGVVWFGESLPPDVFRRAWELASQADLLLSIGTSAVVEPAASLARIAAERGAEVVEINPEPALEFARAYPFKSAELAEEILKLL